MPSRQKPGEGTPINGERCDGHCHLCGLLLGDRQWDRGDPSDSRFQRYSAPFSPLTVQRRSHLPMANRDNHYEAAFEEYLRGRGVPYVAVDEAKRSVLSDGTSIKSLDFIVSSPHQVTWLVDVKGRRFPSGDIQKQYWKNWCCCAFSTDKTTQCATVTHLTTYRC